MESNGKDPDSAFEGCTSLVSVDLPEGVSIDEGAFKDCPCEEEIKKN